MRPPTRSTPHRPPDAAAGSRPAPFAVPSEYDALLEKGIRLSGEDRAFFIRGRVADLAAQLPADVHPRRVLDFGCGSGDAATHLAAAFPGADVVGVDDSPEAVAWARAHRGAPRLAFAQLAALPTLAAFDLCYVNGVLHHVPRADRPVVVRALHDALAPGGWLALFENNPWNPGTRLVMRRIAFDRDAILLSPPEARRLLADAGFACRRVRSLFWFPRVLRLLRPLEAALAPVPLGAQYWVLARRA